MLVSSDENSVQVRVRAKVLVITPTNLATVLDCLARYPGVIFASWDLRALRRARLAAKVASTFILKANPY